MKIYIHKFGTKSTEKVSVITCNLIHFRENRSFQFKEVTATTYVHFIIKRTYYHSRDFSLTEDYFQDFKIFLDISWNNLV